MSTTVMVPPSDEELRENLRAMRTGSRDGRHRLRTLSLMSAAAVQGSTRAGGLGGWTAPPRAYPRSLSVRDRRM
jgi:hypothetical protein